MADNMYTQALARAAEVQGSTQALASLLRVPENTLLRWMSGRAQMPLQAFLRLLEVLAQYERSGGQATLEDSNGEPLKFSMGEMVARCVRCDCTEFVLAEPETKVKYTTVIACRACGERTTRGDLIAQVAKDTIQQSRAMMAARKKRHEQLLRKTPALRNLNPPAKQKNPLDESEES